MKNLFILALILTTLGGCSSMNMTSSYSDSSEPPETDYFEANLSSVTYLHSLNIDSQASGPTMGASVLAARVSNQSSWN